METLKLKVCSKCKIEKTTDKFYKWRNYGDGFYPSCKECKNVLKKSYIRNNPEKIRILRKSHYEKNKEKIIKRTTEYTKNHPEIRRKIMLKHQYGISEEFYKTLEISQNGKCAICFIIPNDHVLFVDHCHDTKKIRGLLCRKCNSLLGFCNDKKDILLSALNYLNKEKFYGMAE